jgi:hypothetical protein
VRCSSAPVQHSQARHKAARVLGRPFTSASQDTGPSFPHRRHNDVHDNGLSETVSPQSKSPAAVPVHGVPPGGVGTLLRADRSCRKSPRSRKSGSVAPKPKSLRRRRKMLAAITTALQGKVP